MVVDALQQQAFVVSLRREIGFLQQACRDGQPGLRIRLAGFAQQVPQAKQSLRGDGAGRGIDRLVVVVRIGRFGLPIAQPVQLRRSRIPVADAVESRRLLHIEVAAGARCAFHPGQCLLLGG